MTLKQLIEELKINLSDNSDKKIMIEGCDGCYGEIDEVKLSKDMDEEIVLIARDITK